MSNNSQEKNILKLRKSVYIEVLKSKLSYQLKINKVHESKKKI
jgi:hypothetical protein